MRNLREQLILNNFHFGRVKLSAMHGRSRLQSMNHQVKFGTASWRSAEN